MVTQELGVTPTQTSVEHLLCARPCLHAGDSKTQKTNVQTNNCHKNVKGAPKEVLGTSIQEGDIALETRGMGKSYEAFLVWS